MGPLAVEAIAEQVHAAGAAIDVHLMIERPERQVEAFAEGGRGLDHRPRRGHAARALRVAGDPRRGLPAPGSRSTRARRSTPCPSCRRRRHGALHDRQPRLGRPGVPRDTRSASWSGCACCSARSRRSRWTAGSTTETAAPLRRRRRDGVRRRARRCSARQTRGSGQGHRAAISGRSWPSARLYGQPYVKAFRAVTRIDPRGLHRPHRRRPPVVSGERARAPGERGFQRHRRGGGRRERRRGDLSAASPSSCCWTCSCPTSTASTSRRASPGHPDSPAVILVSSRDSSDFGPLVSRSGARGFVPKAELSGERVQELLV